MTTEDTNQMAVNLSAEGRQKLAAGVFKQAVQDLRRFHCPRNSTERELYYDAYSWLMSEDEVWPFSFLNVCQALNLSPQQVRCELIGDVSAGPFRYLLRRCGRAAHGCAAALSQLFRDEISTEANGAVLSDPAPSNAL